MRNPICRTALRRILAGRASDWPPAAFYCPRFFFDERLPNARRSRARALLAPRTGQTVRGRVGVGVRVRLGLGLGLGGVCAGTWDKSVPKRPAKIRCRPALQIGAPHTKAHKHTRTNDRPGWPAESKRGVRRTVRVHTCANSYRPTWGDGPTYLQSNANTARPTHSGHTPRLRRSDFFLGVPQLRSPLPY